MRMQAERLRLNSKFRTPACLRLYLEVQCVSFEEAAGVKSTSKKWTGAVAPSRVTLSCCKSDGAMVSSPKWSVPSCLSLTVAEIGEVRTVELSRTTKRTSG